MRTLRVAHLDNAALLSALRSIVSRERIGVAALLEHLGEVEARGLFLPAGYASMFAYCVGEFLWTEQTAVKRLRAARAAREFPEILDAVADGRLNVSAVLLLRPHLNPENASELMSAAARRTRAELEEMLAQRFPKDDVPTRIRPLGTGTASGTPWFGSDSPAEVSPGTPGSSADMGLKPCDPPTSMVLTCRSEASGGESSPEEPRDIPGSAHEPRSELRSDSGGVESQSAGAETSAPHRPSLTSPPPRSVPRSRVSPLAPERFALQVTIDRRTYDLLRRAQELLSHSYESGEVDKVLGRALEALVHGLERRKFAATARPRPARAQDPKGRHVPAHVRRAVSARDGHQCTFVGENRRRCGERSRLEYDHVQPFALGGRATVDGVRLRCRAHNLYAAELVFGAGFMAQKRRAAREARDRRAASG